MRRSTPLAAAATCVLALAGIPTAASGTPTDDPSRPAPRAGSGAVVFISDRDSPSRTEIIDDVYLYDRGSGLTSRLTNDSRVEQFPVISPDGRYLSYIVLAGSIEVCPLRYRDGIWSCGASRGVVSYPTPGGRFAWTPDSRSIVYSGAVADDTDSDLYLINLMSLRAPRNLTEEPAGQPAVIEFQPTVSPDGRFVVYTANGDLYQRRIDGSSLAQLTATAGAIEFGAEYSPAGTRLAFHSNRPAADNFDIYVMRPRPESRTNPAVDLTDEVTAPDGGPSRERFPTWSPDGREIAFWWHVTPQGFDDGEIYVMAADGTRIRNVTNNNPADPAVQAVGDIFPDWGLPVRRR
jgi:Tol biopolymer transport system component